MADSFIWADKVLGGALEETLRKWASQGDSVVTMAAKLERLGIEVSRETVRRWCRDVLHIDLSKKASA